MKFDGRNFRGLTAWSQWGMEYGHIGVPHQRPDAETKHRLPVYCSEWNTIWNRTSHLFVIIDKRDWNRFRQNRYGDWELGELEWVETKETHLWVERWVNHFEYQVKISVRTLFSCNRLGVDQPKPGMYPCDRPPTTRLPYQSNYIGRIQFHIFIERLSVRCHSNDVNLHRASQSPSLWRKLAAATDSWHLMPPHGFVFWLLPLRTYNMRHLASCTRTNQNFELLFIDAIVCLSLHNNWNGKIRCLINKRHNVFLLLWCVCQKVVE